MTVYLRVAKPAALLIVLASATGFASAARADTGWLWFDSVFATPRAAPAPTSNNLNPVSPMRRTRLARPAIVPASAPQPTLVSTATESRSGCFWCGRPVHISGLSF